MVDNEYATFAAAWAQIHAYHAVSCIRNGRCVLSFRLRPRATITPATLRVLIESRYHDAAFLKPTAPSLEALPARFRQAPRDGLERGELFRLFDGFLLRGALPDDLILMSRAPFEDEHLRTFEAAHPDLYAHMVKTGNVTCLGRIRNCGSLSPAQEKAVRGHMLKKAKKGGKASQQQAPRDRDQEEKQRAINAEIRRINANPLFNDDPV